MNLSELDIRAGKILGIRGHNGSGKSTLLRIIALLEPPDSGTVLSKAGPPGPTICISRRQVTLPLQTPYLLSRSVASNVVTVCASGASATPPSFKTGSPPPLPWASIPPFSSHRRRHELSGGECQRVAPAARLALRPRVL
ncbi:MAG: ATP-binding cassette domain-containing protein [Bilophila wadsworthia]